MIQVVARIAVCVFLGASILSSDLAIHMENTLILSGLQEIMNIDRNCFFDESHSNADLISRRGRVDYDQLITESKA